MKVLVQWATDPPGGWVEIDSRDWASLPQKPEPALDRTPIYDRNPADPKSRVIGFTGTQEVIDNQPGWVNHVCVQGLGFIGDHTAIIHHHHYVEIITWMDDPVDLSTDNFFADVWKLYPRIVDRSIKVGNTTMRSHGPLQYRTMYISQQRRQVLENQGYLPNFTSGGETEVKDYSQFSPPDRSLVRHGIWALAELQDKLKALKARPWKEWF